MSRGKGQHVTRHTASLGAGWDEGAQTVFVGLRDWRARHPTATLAEIEAETDQQLAHLRAQLVGDLALASAAAEMTGETPPLCPLCGGPVRDEGIRERTLLTVGNAPVTLRRDYATCARCGSRLFPPRP